MSGPILAAAQNALISAAPLGGPSSSRRQFEAAVLKLHHAATQGDIDVESFDVDEEDPYDSFFDAERSYHEMSYLFVDY